MLSMHSIASQHTASWAEPVQLPTAWWTAAGGGGAQPGQQLRGCAAAHAQLHDGHGHQLLCALLHLPRHAVTRGCLVASCWLLVDHHAGVCVPVWRRGGLCAAAVPAAAPRAVHQPAGVGAVGPGARHGGRAGAARRPAGAAGDHLLLHGVRLPRCQPGVLAGV
ncbi:hypothetical protein COO60DRAFT_798163 [Scenedesmus sp. NREL 46B-D3]|nr:hypothetical protein COO60DRAFT_798163 [Scenedesmus sp. NREL 46B-D3]